MLGHLEILRRHWPLIRFLVATKRRGSVFGMLLGKLWFILNPLAQVIIYYFLIVVIFRAGPRQGISPFVLIMMGLVHYGLLQQSVSAAGTAILQREKLLLQVHIEPIIFVAASFYDSIKNFAISLGVYMIAHAVAGPELKWQAWCYPAILLLAAVFAWSACLLISTLSIFFRDLQNIMQVAMRILLYLSPVLYSISLVPESHRTLYLYNPIGCLFALLQWSLLGTPPPPPPPIVSMLVVAVIMVAAAHLVYIRLRPGITKAI